MSRRRGCQEEITVACAAAVLVAWIALCVASALGAIGR